MAVLTPCHKQTLCTQREAWAESFAARPDGPAASASQVSGTQTMQCYTALRPTLDTGPMLALPL